MKIIIGLLFLSLCISLNNFAQGLPTAKPEEEGLSSTRLKRIEAVMQKYVEEKKVPGFITMIARRGKVVHFEKLGMMDIEANKPMEFDTIFRIYSMTKPVTSVAIMILYEEGHFQLNDPVSKFIPGFKDLKVFESETDEGIQLSHTEREMTIRDLLTHTSGLTYGWGDRFVDKMYQKANIWESGTTIKDMTAKLSQIPLVHQPGSEWEYGLSTDVLGYLVEVISGKSFDVFLEKMIFEPLGMVDTGFYVPKEKIDRFSANYRPDEEAGIKLVDAPTKSDFASGPRTFLSGGGGLVSTASDYMRFCQMLLNKGELDGKRILGRKTVELMTMNHLSDDMKPFGSKGVGFGLGFAVVTDVAQAGQLGSKGVFSWGGAAATTFWIDPKEELVGILMTQLMSNPHPFQDQFKVLTYQAIID